MSFREIIKFIFELAFVLIIWVPIFALVIAFLWHWWPILLHLAALAGMVLLLGGINAVCKSGGVVITVPKKKKKDD